MFPKSYNICFGILKSFIFQNVQTDSGAHHVSFINSHLV